MDDKITPRNFIAKALRIHPQQVVKPKRGRGSFARRNKHEETLDDGS